MSTAADSRSIAYSADTAGRSGRITCQVVRNHRTDEAAVVYTIVVRNDTAFESRVLAFVPDVEDLRHQTIVQSIVGAYAIFSTAVELELARFGGIPDVRIEIAGDDIAFAIVVPLVPGAASRVALAQLAHANGTPRTSPSAGGSLALPARPPALAFPPAIPAFAAQRPTRRSAARDVAIVAAPSRSPSVGPTFLTFVALVGVVAFTILRPTVAGLDVPNLARAGAALPIVYRATGVGRVRYRVVDPDANVIAAGPLESGAGTFTIRLPAQRASRAYLVSVDITGPLGSAIDQRYVKTPATVAIVASARPAPPQLLPPQIRSLALDRGSPVAGDTLNVYYDVAATTGSVTLLDPAEQITYGRSDLSASGHTAFVLPAGTTPRFLNVVITAKRGPATTQSRVAVTVAPQPSPTPQTTPTVDAGSEAAAVVPLVTVPSTIRAGQTFSADIRDGVAGLTLVLTDNDGTEIARREFTTAAAQDRATFSAPGVTATTRFRLTATYPQGDGSETVVKTIDVRP